jgi:protoporphyrinogen oxidase
MRYAIIGAGISGLSVANMLSQSNEVVIFEKDKRPGGMIKCDRIDGCLFHRTGGHVFNTKRKDVFDWFWSHFDKDKDFTKATRNSSVAMPSGEFIPYPIENHIYKLPKSIGEQIIDDLIAISNVQNWSTENFEQFLKERFGDTLYNLYFKPYNYKIWRRNLSDVPLSWLEGKLPMPTVKEIIYNNIFHIEEQDFVHSSFYYPKVGGSQYLAEKLAKKLDVRYGSHIETASFQNGKWNIDGAEFDRVIFCGNIKDFPSIFKDLEEITPFKEHIDNLESHGTTSVFCEINDNPYSWVYQPDMKHMSHRIICTGNFAESNRGPSRMTGTIEFTDEVEREDIVQQLSKMPFSPRYITHNYEQYTYPLQKEDTRRIIREIKDAIAPKGIYLCGRFAEWEYANMDVCIGYAIDLCKKLESE